jgi:tRNA dimethylallyltransferase
MSRDADPADPANPANRQPSSPAALAPAADRAAPPTPPSPQSLPIPPTPPTPLIIAIVGATATGKSRLALALAERLAGGGEIVNADALQAYRGFDIGTAKPDAAERRRVPHHLIDVLDPAERYSAGEFARRARAAIDAIRARGRRPLVVGGSGLYLRALVSGISPIPASDPRLRAELRRRAAAEGLAPLVAELARLDPPTAARLPPCDTQRVLRALEVALASGRPLSAWIAEQPFGSQRIAAVRIGLTLPRAILYDRIAGRVARMVEEGWTEEVRGLLQRGLTPDLPAFQAIGYRQLVYYVRGEWSLAKTIDETVRATRRFAKRQETWFRKEPDVTWFSAEDLDRRIPQVLEHVERGCGEGSA